MQITKKSLIIGLLALPCIANAQEREAITKIGINYSADYTYRKLSTEDFNSRYIMTVRNSIESPAYGFNTGATFLHQFRFGLILEGGIQYSRFSEKIKNITYVNSNGEDVGKATFFNNYDYLSVPIKVGYGFPIGKRIVLSASTGIATNYYLARHTTSEVKYNDGSSGEFKDTYKKEPDGNQFTSFNFVSVSSIGVDIQLFNSFSVRFEPTMRYSLNAMRNDGIQQRPYSYGINTTLFYKFGNSNKKEKAVE